MAPALLNDNEMKLRFLGATQTVTGSRYLLTSGKTRILVDCGLFQGYKNLRLKNWDEFAVPPSSIGAVLLTHAHLDHSGYLPLLVKSGFRGKIYCTKATRDLCSILLADCGYLQEEEAKFANKHGFSKHRPAMPLYTQHDAETCMEYFETVDWRTRHTLHSIEGDGKVEFEFHPSGHLFGAASILVSADGDSIAFSGDLGRTSDPITRDPSFSAGADTLVVESTYGNRKHIKINAEQELADTIVRTYDRKGTTLIPSFAVGRAQLVLHYIHRLKQAGKIPDIPVYLNSPMALRANDVFCKHFAESKMSHAEAKEICATAAPILTTEESIALNERLSKSKEQCIIVAASGMATGGRVLHHLKTTAPDPANTIIFAGYQAGGTRGDLITRGANEIKIHGEYWPVRAEVMLMDSMSAHADGDEILSWISQLKRKPKQVYVTHGDQQAADELRLHIEERLRIDAIVPEFGQEFELRPREKNPHV